MAIGDGCAVTAPRLEVVDAAGLAEVRVLAGAGTLRIAGEPARGDVRIEGTACAPRERDLERLEVVVTRTGGSLLIEAPPEGPSQGRIDLVIAMPAELPVGVTDGSGSLEIRGVAAVGLDDGSGGVAISDIAGDVRARDGSGGLDIRRVGGGVVIELDGSGSIDVREVGGDVVIGQDGSGGIDVADVGGDFTVGADGSGGVEWRRVAGRVQAARD
jgi:hypothetical protein